MQWCTAYLRGPCVRPSTQAQRACHCDEPPKVRSVLASQRLCVRPGKEVCGGATTTGLRQPALVLVCAIVLTGVDLQLLDLHIPAASDYTPNKAARRHCLATSANMSYRGGGARFTGSNDIPLGTKRRFGGDEPPPPPPDDSYAPMPSRGRTETRRK